MTKDTKPLEDSPWETGKRRGQEMADDIKKDSAKDTRTWEEELYNKLHQYFLGLVHYQYDINNGYDEDESKFRKQKVYLDGNVKDFISSLLDQARKEERERINYIKEAEKFEKEMTQGFGIGNIQGMGNVHLFAQKLQELDK